MIVAAVPYTTVVIMSPERECMLSTIDNGKQKLSFGKSNTQGSMKCWSQHIHPEGGPAPFKLHCDSTPEAYRECQHGYFHSNSISGCGFALGATEDRGESGRGDDMRIVFH